MMLDGRWLRRRMEMKELSRRNTLVIIFLTALLTCHCLGDLTTRKVKAVCSYKGGPGMISLTKGEELEEVKPDEDGWTVVKKRNGGEGAVPTKHLGMKHNL